MMMTPIDGRVSPFVHFFARYNPFYVMSAMCMLFGIFAVNDSLDWSPIPLNNLIVMIITLNGYEIGLIGPARCLLGVRAPRDALLRMLIETFFIRNVRCLNM